MNFIIWHLLAIFTVIAVSFCIGVIYGIKHSTRILNLGESKWIK